MLEQLVQEQGGKFAILTYLQAKNPKIPIPKYFVHGYDERDNIASDLKQLKPPYIARTSYRHELWGFAGLFDSIGGLVTAGEVQNSIRQIKSQVDNPDIQLYAQQMRFDSEKKIHVGIQEQSTSVYNGYMMRHPNQREIIIINISHGEGFSRDNEFLFFDEKTNRLINRHDRDGDYEFKLKISKSGLREAIDYFKESERILGSTQLLVGYALQMEFGLEPTFVYQLRPFKKIESAEFSVPKVKNDENSMHTYECFGVTPEDGITIPAVRGFSSETLLYTGSTTTRELIEEGSFHQDEFSLAHTVANLNMAGTFYNDVFPGSVGYKNKMTEILRNYRSATDETFKEGYCFLTEKFERDDKFAVVSIPNMKVFVEGGTLNYLTHSIFMQLQKSDISLVKPTSFTEFYENLHTGDTVRVISNGREAVVIKE